MACVGIMRPAIAQGQRVMFVVHLREVVRQTVRALQNCGVEADVLMASEQRRIGAPAIVASVQTVDARKEYPPGVDIIVFDEAHRAAAPMYLRLQRAYPRARFVGLTATPVRTDGKSLAPPDAPFTDMVVATTPSALIRDGHLVDVQAYGFAGVELDGVRVRAGEFVSSDTGRRMSAVVGDVVEQWQRHAQGLRTVVFCASVEHAKRTAEAFRGAGESVELLTGKTSDKRRQEIVRRLRKEPLILVNCDVLTEGFDEPLIGAVVVAKPTMSLGRWIQMAGRGLRPITESTAEACRDEGVAVPSKRHVILLDHGLNLQRHGWPTADRQWSLIASDSRQRDGAAAAKSVTTCKMCGFSAPYPFVLCPGCGASARPAQMTTLHGQLERLSPGEVLVPRRTPVER